MATGKKVAKLTSDVSPSADSCKQNKTGKHQSKDPFEMEDQDIFQPTRKYSASKKKAKVNPDSTSQQAMKKKLKDTVDSDNRADDISGLIDQYRQIKQKVKVDDTKAEEVHKKVSGLFGEQRKARKQLTECLMTNCSEVFTQIKADYEVMEANEQKLDQITGSFMKCIQQATSSFKENAKAFSKIHLLKKQFDEMESRQMEEQKEMVCEFDNNIKKLQNKLEKESRRQAWEQMCRRISHAIQDN